jgi:hypothetical protein
MTIKVTAPMITALTENDRVVYLYRGDVVPEGLAKDSLEHLKSLGFITESEAPTKDPDEGVKPAGNASLEAWQKYAESQGLAVDDLDGKTRDDIRALFND